jgi:hypothetical protein
MFKKHEEKESKKFEKKEHKGAHYSMGSEHYTKPGDKAKMKALKKACK